MLSRRLVPLYIAAFFQSLVLFYPIEKLFMRSIGFSNTEIGFMIAVYSAAMLAVETPLGILADRWSRKGVLMISSGLLSLSLLIGGFSHDIRIYLIAAVLWGMFFVCYSGIYDSIVYDAIAESTQSGRLFDSLYGRIQLLDGVGLALGALAGGFVASLAGLRATYFLSIPLALVPIIVLARFREPTIHKKQVAMPLKHQVAATFRAVLRNRSLATVVVVLIIRSMLFYILYEFAQLWLLALHAPTAYYGPANAVLLASLGVGGAVTSRLRLSRYPAMLAILSLMLLGCAGLIIFRSIAAIVTAQFVIGTGLIVLAVIFNRILHDSLSPSIRAGAASAANTVSRLFVIPLALTFGYVSRVMTIYKASYILLVLMVAMAAFVIAVAKRNGNTGLEPKQQ